MIHVPIAIAIQMIGVLLFHLGFSPVVIGAVGGFAVCFMREVTQAEYRWIEANGGLRAAMPGYEGLLVWKWNRHSLLETLAPVLGMAVVAFWWSYAS